ncbi:MAG: outer membrane protein assembly factor BamD [Pelagibacterales bacterium MED-G40]|nr:MAG: outer membrane protein assembly factor BamD [Pelagibacterales bacterium MED-G40]
MYQKIIYFFLILFLFFSCSKKEPVVVQEFSDKEKAMEIYQEAINNLDDGFYFQAAKQFSEAEIILDKIEFSARASLMSSYCYYLINFYDEAIENLEKFIKKYPVDKNIPYAHYLITISYYERILDEERDITPLLKSKEKIYFFLENYPNTEYALDLKFKLDLINNQLAAKELFIAKYYIETQKWIAAINRLKTIVEIYSETIFIEEALHRLTEIYYKIGLVEEAEATVALLGYNYNSGEWYERSYKILNKNYQIKKKNKNEKQDDGLIKRTIKRILE